MLDEQKKIFRQACRESISEVYETTLQLTAAFDENAEQLRAAHEKSVIATIGFAGCVEGSLVMIVSDRIACGLVSSMLSTEITVMDPEVLDGIGEILNMIAGGMKRKGDLATFDFNISIPSVALVENQMCVATLKNTECLAIAVGSTKGSALFLLSSVVNGKEPRRVNVRRNDQQVARSLQDLVKDKDV